MTNTKLQRAFDSCLNQRPLMTLKGHCALCCKTHASFGTSHENLNEDRPILSATKMYPNDSSFCQYNWCEILGEGASKDSGVIENVDFHCFRTLRLRQS